MPQPRRPRDPAVERELRSFAKRFDREREKFEALTAERTELIRKANRTVEEGGGGFSHDEIGVIFGLTRQRVLRIVKGTGS